jgi:hypothetical protein
MRNPGVARNQAELEVVRRWVADRLQWERFLATAGRGPAPVTPSHDLGETQAA